MRRYLLLLVFSLVIFGCAKATQEKNIVVKINDYEISKAEFEQDFKDSSYAGNDTLESRKDFLNNLINQKLILQEAQRKDMDKDKNFLKMIEKFWEQSLLKLSIDRKSKQISGSVSVSDADVENVYKNMVKEGTADKPYNQMYRQIKWEITKIKESKAMNEWLNELHKNACIEVDESLLKNSK